MGTSRRAFIRSLCRSSAEEPADGEPCGTTLSQSAFTTAGLPGQSRLHTRFHGLLLLLLLTALSACTPVQPEASAPDAGAPDAGAHIASTATAPPAAPDRPSAPRASRALTQYVHQAWSTADGLPYAGVWAITQTRDGYLWIGSRGGLSRFDGKRFVTFDARTTPELQSHAVTSLYEDRNGTLWAGTLGGLARFRDGQFSFYTTDDGLPSDNIWSVEGAPDGTLWIGTLGGLARLRNGRFTAYTAADGLLGNDVRAVSVAPDGAVWVGTYGSGVNRLVDDRWTTYAFDGSPSGALIHGLHAGRDGVWVGVGEGQVDQSPHQWLKLDGEQFVPVAPTTTLISVRALLEEHNGALWAGTYGGGLVRLADGALQAFTTQEGLSDDRVQALYEDRAGNLWVGTMSGLDLLRRDAPFTTYAAAEGLPHDNVRAVTQDAAGAVWAATAGGLARLDSDGTTAFTRGDGLTDTFVHALLSGRDGDLWLGGQHAVTRYADGMFTRFELPGAWPREAIWSIVEDAAGHLWLGSTGAGLIRFEPGDAHALTTADGLTHNSITSLLVGQNGALWVGTASGLNVVVDGHVRPFEGQEHFGGLNVRSMYEDADGTLWVGTYGRGLLRLRDGRVAVYTTREGLHDDGIWSILTDDQGWLWMSGDRGVFRVARADLEAVAAGHQRLLTPIAYGVADGMRSAEANGASKPSGWRTRDGQMWFATQQGLVVVDPAAVVPAVPAPIVEYVQTQQGTADRSTDGAVMLPAATRDFTIAYTSLSFANPEQLRFRYRLDGFTNGWVEAEERREAAFTNVPAGSYSFHVAVRNGNSGWRESPTALRVTVAPFAWETTWFRLLGALAAVALAALTVHTVSRRQRQRADALEALVAARTDELRRAKETTEAQARRLLELNTLKSRFFANVSHEFRTPLTLTLGPLNDMKAGLYGELSAPMVQQVDLARRNATRVLDLINQILEVARLEAGRTALHARPLDLSAFVEDVAKLFQTSAERKAITFEVSLPPTPVEVFADPPQLEKVIVNLLSNALKFTPEGGAVRVTVAAEADAARVDVRDSGPGIPPADLPHLFDRFYQVSEAEQTRLGTGIGLALAKEIVDLHGGTLAVESEKGFGSTFTLTLLLGRAHLTPDQIDETAPIDETAKPWTPDATRPAADADNKVIPAADSEDAADRTTILVVDDHPEVRAYVRRHLEAAPEGHPSYRILEAADGEAGLALAKARLPDLVLSDVMMPKLDGLGLCRALKADTDTDFIPVILLTAKAAPEDRLEGLGELADDYLTKPFDVAELRARIANLITVRMRLRERFRREGMVRRAGEPPTAAMRLPPPEPAPSAADVFLERVREAVEVHLGDDTFSVQRLADEVGVSRGHLHRQLKALVGQTPTDLIRTMRLERATHLLADRVGTVSEIAYAVGFKSVSHFSDSFARTYRCRPSDYATRAGADGDETA